jgi:very-short-patch-repair endonuclease
MLEEHPRDRALSALAARQHGVVAHRQLLELGMGRGAIHHRLAVGRLHRVHLGVYAVGHAAISPNGRLMAGVLACGPEAVLSHRSAAWLWGLQPLSDRPVDVTVAGRSRHRRVGIAVHRTRNLHREDRKVRERIPVTSVARTLVDLAEVVRPAQLERALEEAERLRLFDLRAIGERYWGRRGLRPLRALLAEAGVAAEPTRSKLERRFLALCREEDLPAPAVNMFVAGFEVDVLWAEQRLVVELDGYAFHGNRPAFERDRVRDAALQLAGYRVLRVTHRRLETGPASVAAMVRSVLWAPPRQTVAP